MQQVIRTTAAVSCIAACLILSPSVLAGPQQDKMTACNKEAGEKNLKGDERKAFMQQCLSAKKADDADAKSSKQEAKKSEGAGSKSQQDKMTSCNKEAGEKNLKGDERKKFMSACLKG